MIFFVFMILLWCSLGFEGGGVKEVKHQHCRVCKYDLAGLGDEAVCPECGIDAPHTDFITLPTNVVLRWPVFARALGVMAVWLIVGALWRELVGALVAIHYVMADLPLSKALWLAQQNELNSSRMSNEAMLSCIWPMQLALLPMVATVRMPWKWYLRINPVLIAVGVILLVARWVVPHA